MSDKPSYPGNLARAFGSQGLMMGWGDEAEAWTRSKLGDEPYEQALAEIRGDYGQFAEENPWSQGLGEVAGAVIPGIASMLIPGAQPAAPAALGGTAARMAALFGPATVARATATGAVAGGLSAAGAAEGDKLGAVLPGVVAGGGLGAVVPLAGRAGSGAYGMIRDRVAPSAESIDRRAGDLMLEFTRRGGGTPQDIPLRLAQDRAMGVPSVVANTNPGLARLTEGVAQRADQGAIDIEQKLTDQLDGQRERLVQQTRNSLGAGDYFADLEALQAKTKAEAKEAYAKAYADGSLTDPKKLRKFRGMIDGSPMLTQSATGAARKIADARGETFDIDNPTLETLDQFKRGIDTLIDGETDSFGKVTTLGREYLTYKNKLLKLADDFSPDYKAARAQFGDNKTVEAAYRTGMDDYLKMPHEEASRLVSSMRPSDRQALRTGVARKMYDMVMLPANNVNPKRLLAPEMRARMQPLFNNPAEYRLFEAALEREAQLFSTAGKVLQNSSTARRQQMGEVLDSSTQAGAVQSAVKGDFVGSLMGLVNNLFLGARLPEKTADRLATLLMSRDPSDVAAAVELMERAAARQVPEKLKSSAKQGAAITGFLGAAPAPPLPPQEDEEQ